MEPTSPEERLKYFETLVVGHVLGFDPVTRTLIEVPDRAPQTAFGSGWRPITSPVAPTPSGKRELPSGGPALPSHTAKAMRMDPSKETALSPSALAPDASLT